MKDVLLTTSESLNGWEILEYKYPVFSHVVSGAGFLSEFNAAFSDIFGSRSGSYEKRLQSLNQRALEILKQRAREAGANCIVGLRVDSDQINGKNTQLFMITAYGTAVVAKNLKSQTLVNAGKEIDVSSVKDRTKLLRLISQVNDPNVRIPFDDLELIVESKMPVFKDYILSRVKILASQQGFLDTPDGKRAFDLYSKYFAIIEDDEVIKSIYDEILKEPLSDIVNALVSIIVQNDLVNYKEVEKLLLSGSIDVKKQAFKILSADKLYYSLNDVGEINNLINIIADSFPQLGAISSKKGFLSSNEKEIWVCKCGKNNSMDYVYCFSCNNDIYGFKSDDTRPAVMIDFLKRKAIAISELIR